MRFHRCSLIFFVRYFEMASILASRKHRLEAGRRRGRSAAWAGRTFSLYGHTRVPTHRIVRFLRNRCFPGGSEAEGGRRPPGRQIEARGRKTHADEFRLLLARSSVTPTGLAQTFLFSYRRRPTRPCREVPASQRSETRSIRAAHGRLGTR